MGAQVIWARWDNIARLKLKANECLGHDNVVYMRSMTTPFIGETDRLIKTKLSGDQTIIVKQTLKLRAERIKTPEVGPTAGALCHWKSGEWAVHITD